MKSISPTKNPSDRFIPISISPNLKCEINDHSQTPSPNNHSNYEIDNKHKLKAGETYKKLLFKELLDPPSSNSYSNDSNNDINNNTFKLCYSSISKRKINFSSNTTNINQIIQTLLIKKQVNVKQFQYFHSVKTILLLMKPKTKTIQIKVKK